MDNLPDRVAALKLATEETRVDFLRTILSAASVLANLAETEQSLNRREAAGRALRQAEERFAVALGFLSDRKHSIGEESRQVLLGPMEQVRNRLDQVRRQIERHAP